MAEGRSSTIDTIFSECVNRVDEGRFGDLKTALRTLSSIIASSARPSPSALKKLSRAAEDSFKTMCMEAVMVAVNPFISGTILTTTLAAAANMSPEGERRKLNDVRTTVDSLLLEVFERLPQTVKGFGGGRACCAILEPKLRKKDETSEPEKGGSEKLIGYSIGGKGPLTLMLEKGKTRDTYSSVPLIIDFMSYRFTQGLPGYRDTYGDVEDRKRSEGVKEAKVWSVHDLFWQKSFVEMLRGSGAEVPSLTVLPGAQYIVAGLVQRPNDFYEVPAMRMALDFVVYLAMIAALSYLVLFQHGEGEGALSWVEVTFGTVFILVRWRGEAKVVQITSTVSI